MINCTRKAAFLHFEFDILNFAVYEGTFLGL